MNLYFHIIISMIKNQDIFTDSDNDFGIFKFLLFLFYALNCFYKTTLVLWVHLLCHINNHTRDNDIVRLMNTTMYDDEQEQSYFDKMSINIFIMFMRSRSFFMNSLYNYIHWWYIRFQVHVDTNEKFVYLILQDSFYRTPFLF